MFQCTIYGFIYVFSECINNIIYELVCLISFALQIRQIRVSESSLAPKALFIILCLSLSLALSSCSFAGLNLLPWSTIADSEREMLCNCVERVKGPCSLMDRLDEMAGL